jgi:DHA1 family bicyclomycin/chloramphenicol resistance-like MFS transporter
VQLTFSVFVLCYGGAQLAHGPLSDRHGRRKVLLIGLSLAAVGSALAALAPNVTTLTLARALQGAGAAAGMVVGRAMVNDLFEGAARTRMMAWTGMAMGLCPPLATVVGGQLHMRLGWQANFVLMTLLALGLIAAAWRVLPGGAAPATQPAAPRHGLAGMLRDYAQLLRDPALRGHVLLLSMATATFYALLGAAPLVLRSYGVGPDRVGLYIMFTPIAYIVGNFITTRLAHRVGDRWMMIAGKLVTLTGLVLLLALALGGMNDPLALALPLTLIGVGHGLLVPPALAGTVGLVPALAGSAAALAGISQQFIGAFAGYVVGWFGHDDAQNMGWVMLSFSLVGAAALAALLRHQARTASASSG